MQRIKLAVADDQNLFRQSLCALLRTIPEFDLIHEAINGVEFLELLKNTALPDVALVDIDMPEMNGIELTGQLQSLHPSIKIIILSVHTEERLVAQLIEDGAHAYLAKNCDKSELILAIKNVHANGFYMNSDMFNAIHNSSSHKDKTVKGQNELPFFLTKREKQILRLICQQYNNAEISERLFVSARTIEWHRNNLLIKTESRNTAGLVLFSLKYQLFSF